MATPPRIRLTEAEKDALLLEQAALIERMAARIAELEALVGKPRKTSSNSSIPPSQNGPGRQKRDRKPPRKVSIHKHLESGESFVIPCPRPRFAGAWDVDDRESRTL